MGWICHVVPFHRSASGRHTRDRLTVIPTASHADGDTQDTPSKALHAAPAGLGIGWMRQLLPSHRVYRGRRANWQRIRHRAGRAVGRQ